MRIFLAVFPPADVQEAAAGVIERLRRPGDGLSWVRRENLHYTVRFLGEQDDRGLARARGAAREGASGHRRFEARLGEVGAFPSARRARVLWLGLTEGAEPLAALARSVENALRAQGFEPAERPFSSHLTLGRVRQRDQDWSGRLAGVQTDPAPRFVVDRVRVVHSTLSPGGSVYRVLEEAPLAP